MIFVKLLLCLIVAATLCAFTKHVEGLSVQYPIRSDAVVTKWPQPEQIQDDKQPGWMRRQLMRFGEVAGRLGNAMGAHATKVTAAIDKICDVIKTIIPFLAAVCHVGQFKFCAAATQGPDQLSQALNPASLDLDELDRK